MKPALFCIAACFALLLPDTQTESEALESFNTVVGEWRGTGQVRRGSSRGAWSESAVCEWKITDKQRSIIFKVKDGKQFERLELKWDRAAQQFLLQQKYQDTDVRYRSIESKDPGRKLQFVSDPLPSGEIRRLTWQKLSDVRQTILLEKQSSAKAPFRRIAAIGYTRDGARLASGSGGRKCIVTGGTGTIAVSHKGKTYYVCCQGCVQAFNDDPDGIIAAYQESLKAEAK